MQRLKKHTFKIHTTAFLMILLPSALLYVAAQEQATGLSWLLLGLVVLGNLLVLFVN
jgi:hypothetical protein